MNLLGIDVGFSATRPTTGIAWSVAGEIGAARTFTDWERRKRVPPPGASFNVIAIDGPLIASSAPAKVVRRCEQLLSRGLFQKRCKPGASHSGSGFQLRQAAAETARQFRHLGMLPNFSNAILADAAIVEAFPNAFLGVMLDDDDFAAQRISRGKKFDHLYDRVVSTNRIAPVIEEIGWQNWKLVDRIIAERDHERRAALICLLTAACAASGKATTVGDDLGGWIWLPPIETWGDWAKRALATNLAAR
jgi:predicted nuclease with RNAse H fold